MELLQLASLLLVAAAAFGAVNYLFLKLPSAIGILIVALAASFLIILTDALFPVLVIEESIRSAVLEIEFSDTLLEGMLGLLLFAGALHVKVSDLRQEWLLVALMATIGVGLSTVIAGLGFGWLTGMPLMIALVFGALISPTDPVAVLGVLRAADLPKTLETKIAGESLFNDGVAYVAFLILVGLAFGGSESHVAGFEDAALLFVREAIGGAVLGLLAGWSVWAVLRRVDDPVLEVLITLALALGGYQLAVALHVSAPIAAVCAGLLIGHESRAGITEAGRDYVDTFWKLIDEILNAVLFLMIGAEVFAVAFSVDYLVAGLVSIGLSLLGRLAAVAIPVAILRPFRGFPRGVVPIMTWGGIKGGISVALALSLPETEYKPLILTATYVVVIFSILVQGLTVTRVSERYGHEPELI